MDLRESIERRLKEHGRGYAFTRKDLLDLANSGTIGRVLARLVEDGTIRRIDRGLFNYPRINEKLGGQLSPDIAHLRRRDFHFHMPVTPRSVRTNNDILQCKQRAREVNRAGGAA